MLVAFLLLQIFLRKILAHKNATNLIRETLAVIKRYAKNNDLNKKKLKIKADSGIDEFKIDILKSLNLFDSKKNCLLDFDDRITSYFNRHKNLTIKILIDKEKLSETLFENRFYSLKRYKREIPKNYPFGASNMETQAYYDPIICDEKYYEDKKRIENEIIQELITLSSNFKELNAKFNFDIQMKE